MRLYLVSFPPILIPTDVKSGAKTTPRFQTALVELSYDGILKVDGEVKQQIGPETMSILRELKIDRNRLKLDNYGYLCGGHRNGDKVHVQVAERKRDSDYAALIAGGLDIEKKNLVVARMYF
jgi:hypothetical protein